MTAPRTTRDSKPAPAKAKGKAAERQPRKFAGKLAEPIHWVPAGRQAAGLLSLPRTDAEIQEINDARYGAAVQRAFEKLPALAKEYGFDIDEGAAAGDYKLLALCLALDFVPGFNISTTPAKGPGRPKVWTPERELDLIADVDDWHKRQEGGSDRQAIKALLLQSEYAERWAAFRDQGNKWASKRAIDSLAKRLREARRKNKKPVGPFPTTPYGLLGPFPDWPKPSGGN